MGNHGKDRLIGRALASDQRPETQTPVILPDGRSQFDFRYSNRVKLCIDDDERTALALKGIVRKRLTYRMPHN